MKSLHAYSWVFKKFGGGEMRGQVPMTLLLSLGPHEALLDEAQFEVPGFSARKSGTTSLFKPSP